MFKQVGEMTSVNMGSIDWQAQQAYERGYNGPFIVDCNGRDILGFMNAVRAHSDMIALITPFGQDTIARYLSPFGDVYLRPNRLQGVVFRIGNCEYCGSPQRPVEYCNRCGAPL